MRAATLGAAVVSVILLSIFLNDPDRRDVEAERADEEHEPEREGDSVFGLSKAVSPMRSVTIWTVTVVTESIGLKVSEAMMPAP